MVCFAEANNHPILYHDQTSSKDKIVHILQINHQVFTYSVQGKKIFGNKNKSSLKTLFNIVEA